MHTFAVVVMSVMYLRRILFCLGSFTAIFHFSIQSKRYIIFWYKEGHNTIAHARIQKVLSEGSNFDNVFLVDEGREDQNTTISGTALAS